jgi:hypothetical protein
LGFNTAQEDRRYTIIVEIITLHRFIVCVDCVCEQKS